MLFVTEKMIFGLNFRKLEGLEFLWEVEFQAVGWHVQRPCGPTEPCACRQLTPPAQLELKGEKQDCSGQQGLEYPAEELGPCPKEQKMLVIRQELAPNSRLVKTRGGGVGG